LKLIKEGKEHRRIFRSALWRCDTQPFCSYRVQLQNNLRLFTLQCCVRARRGVGTHRTELAHTQDLSWLPIRHAHRLGFVF
jgi:hypothetical protein